MEAWRLGFYDSLRHGGMEAWRHVLYRQMSYINGGLCDLNLKAQMARAALEKLLVAKDISSADKLLLESRTITSRLLSIDPAWSLDAAFIGLLCGPAAEGRVIARVLEIMPSTTRAVTMQQAIMQVEAMVAEDSMKLTPLGSQSQLKLALAFLRTLHSSGVADCKKQNKSPMLAQVYEAAASFMRIGAGANVQVGVQAMGQLVMSARAKHKGGKTTEGGCAHPEAVFFGWWPQAIPLL